MGILVVIAAYRAGVSGVASGRAGGGGYLGGVAMGLPPLPGLAADAADMAVAFGVGFHFSIVVSGDGQLHGACGGVIGLTSRSFPVTIHGMGKHNLELAVIGGQGVWRPGGVVGEIPAGAVGVPHGDGKACRIKGFILVIGRFLGGCDLQRVDGGTYGHQIGRVIFEVNYAVFVHNRAANGILSLRTAGGKEDIGGIIGHFLTSGIGGFLGQEVRLPLAGPIPENPELAGKVVVKEVDIDSAVLTAFIGGGEQSAGLGIALCPHGVDDRHGGKVNDRNIMAGIGGELSHTGNTYIGPSVINGWGAGAHGGIADIFSIVVQPQTPEGSGGEGAVFFRVDTVKIAALGGEVGSAGAVFLRYEGHGASGIAGVRQHHGIQQLSGHGIQRQELGMARHVTGFAVVGPNKEVVVADIGPRPVESSGRGIAPGGELSLHGICRILVGDRQAHKIGTAHLAVPETGVEIAVMVDQGAVGLAAQGIPIEPQGLQRYGVECLDTAVGQAHKDHAVSVGGGVDGKAGVVIHLAGGYHLAVGPVHLIEIAASVDVEVTVH